MSKLRITVITISAITFLFLSYIVLVYGITNFDTTISVFIQSFRNPALNEIMKVITYLGNWQSIVILSAILISISSTRTTLGIPIGVLCLISTILNEVLKTTFARERPAEIDRLVHASGFSFPSGHSMTGLVFFGLLIILLNRNIIKNRSASIIVTGLLSILILFIGISRIYLGVHYPTDVISGFAAGLSLISLLEPATNSFSSNYIRNKGKF